MVLDSIYSPPRTTVPGVILNWKNSIKSANGPVVKCSLRRVFHSFRNCDDRLHFFTMFEEGLTASRGFSVGTRFSYSLEALAVSCLLSVNTRCSVDLMQTVSEYPTSCSWLNAVRRFETIRRKRPTLGGATRGGIKPGSRSAWYASAWLGPGWGAQGSACQRLSACCLNWIYRFVKGRSGGIDSIQEWR